MSGGGKSGPAAVFVIILVGSRVADLGDIFALSLIGVRRPVSTDRPRPVPSLLLAQLSRGCWCVQLAAIFVILVAVVGSRLGRRLGVEDEGFALASEEKGAGDTSSDGKDAAPTLLMFPRREGWLCFMGVLELGGGTEFSRLSGRGRCET